jgi:DNA-binding IclR family transcriptional regulator
MIQSIQRTVELLNLFSLSRPRWGIAEMSRATGLAKTTVHNIVNTLARSGYLLQDAETRKYALGHKIFTLGTIMAGTLEINLKATGPAQQITGRTGLISRVAVWDTDAALVTLNVTPQYGSSLSQQIGPRVVAYCSAIGRALLAHLEPADRRAYLHRIRPEAFTPRTVTDKNQLRRILDRTRRQGYALNNQELALGQCSIAAAIFCSGGKLTASISLTGAPGAVTGDRMPELIADLRSTAAEISRYLGHYPAEPKARFAGSFRP